MPLNLRPLGGDYFFLLADFLAAGFWAFDFCGFDLADLLAIMLLVFWSLTPLRHVSFPAEEPSMAIGTAAVNNRGEVGGTSNIEFNNSSQHWEVKDRRGKVRFIAKSRSACLEWEQQNLQ